MCAPIDTAEMVHTVVSVVLTDVGFCLPTRPAKHLSKQQKKLLKWSADREKKNHLRNFFR